MKEISSIPVHKNSSIVQLSRIHNSIYGVDLEENCLYEIETKHSLIYPHPMGLSSNAFINCVKIDPSNTVMGDKSGYAFIYDKRIDRIHKKAFDEEEGDFTYGEDSEFARKTVLASNEFSCFTGLVDAVKDQVILTKYHQNHGRHSINWIHGQGEKKVIKLMEESPTNMRLNRLYPQVIYTDSQNHCKYFDLAKPDIETSLIKKSIILFDSWNLYCSSTNLITKFNSTYEIQALDLKSGKSSFTFRGVDSPIQIESFQNTIFYLTEKALYVYDSRKVEPLDAFYADRSEQSQTTSHINSSNARINEFLLEPNLNRIYLSCSNAIKVFQYGMLSSSSKSGK